MPPKNAPSAVMTQARGQNETLDQIIARHRDLILMREYQALGQIDFVFVVRPNNQLLKMDYRKKGPRLAFNPDTSDLLLLNNWEGLPALDAGEGTPCTACMVECGDCQGTGKKKCTLAGCGGTGYVASVYVPCPGCLGGPEQETRPDCKQCRGRGEVPNKTKCQGCDEQGMQKCFRCNGTCKTSSGREKGQKDFLDPATSTWKTAPLCTKCQGKGRIVGTNPQDWTQFYNGHFGGMVCLGPIKSLVWHTLDESGRFQGCEFEPDGAGNLAVLMLENERPGARQYLVGGNPQFKTR